MVISRNKIILAALVGLFILGAFSFSSASDFVQSKSQKIYATSNITAIKTSATEQINLEVPADGLKMPDANTGQNQASTAAQQPATEPQITPPAQPDPVITPAPPAVQAAKTLPKNSKTAIRPVASQNQVLAFNFPAAKVFPQAAEKATQILVPTAKNWQAISSKSPYATDAFSDKTTRILNSLAVLLGLFGLWMYVLSLPVRGRQPENPAILSYAE